MAFEYAIIVLAALTIIACIAYICNETIRAVRGKSHSWLHVLCVGLIAISAMLAISSSVMNIMADNIQRHTNEMLQQMQ
jgi:uncharacterized membrane protein